MSTITMRNKNCISCILFKQGVHRMSLENEPEYLAWMLRYYKSNLLCFKRHAYFSPHESDLSVLCGHTYCDKHVAMCSLRIAMNQSSLGTIKAKMWCDYYYTKYCVVSVPFFLLALRVFYCWSPMIVLWPYNSEHIMHEWGPFSLKRETD